AGPDRPQSVMEGSTNSFREIEPAFSERRDDLLAEWDGITFQIPQMIDSAQETFVQFCQWVSVMDRQHEMEIFLSGVPADSAKAFSKVLLKALKNGARVALHLTHPAGRKSRTRLQDIYGEIAEHPLFSMDHLRVQLPNIVIADQKYVGISSG